MGRLVRLVQEGDRLMANIARSAWIAPGAVVSGDVTVCEGCSIWYNAVARSSEQKIEIGECTNVQDCAVLHTGKSGLTIGKGVTIGHGAIVHCKEVGDNTLIGMGATVLSGAVVGKNCLIAAGALVTENAVIPDGSMVMGVPGKVRRELTPEEIEGNRLNASSYVDEVREEIDAAEHGAVVIGKLTTIKAL